jgi:hypothetical protein
MTVYTISDEATCMYPIQFIEQGEIRLPAPLVRLSTCGGLTIEVLEEVVSASPPQARYRRLAPDKLRGRSIAPALTFLKLLVSQPRRYAKKDFLREHLSRLDEEAATDDRVDDVASLLRGLLYPSSGKETPEGRKRRDKVRKLLVAYVHGSKGSGGGYCLGEYPLVWVDIDALAYHVTQATRMDRFRDPGALPYWERAYHLASPGPYLPDEVYSDWIAGRPEEVEGYLRQSVHALSRLYLACYGEAGEEELQIILRNYWLAHKTDEDVLRPLMELLGKQERYGEALNYYSQCEAALAEQESMETGKAHTPDERTRDIVEYLRTKQIQRGSDTSLHSSRASLSVRVQSQEGQFQRELPPPLSDMHLEQDILRLDSPQCSQTSKQAMPQGIMEVIQQLGEHDHDMKYLSRRKVITALRSLVGATELPLEWWEHLAHLYTSETSAMINPEPWERLVKAREQHAALNEETLKHFERLLGVCWDLSNTQELEAAETVLASFLPKIIALPQKERRIAILASHSLRLWSILTHHRLKLTNKVLLCEQSVEYARRAQDPNSLVPALIELAAAYEYTNQSEKRFMVLQEALYHSPHASPLVQSRAYSRNAVVLAESGRGREAQFYIELARQVFPDDPTQDSEYAFADSNIFRFAYHSGLVCILTGEAAKADGAFDLYKQHPYGSSIPARIQLEITNGKSEAAILRKDAERYADLLEEVIIGSVNIGSKKRFDEAYRIFCDQMPAAWLVQQRIQTLTEKYHLKREE